MELDEKMKKIFGRVVNISGVKSHNPNQSVQNWEGVVRGINTNGHIFVYSEPLGYGYHINLNEEHEVWVREGRSMVMLPQSN